MNYLSLVRYTLRMMMKKRKKGAYRTLQNFPEDDDGLKDPIDGLFCMLPKRPSTLYVLKYLWYNTPGSRRKNIPRTSSTSGSIGVAGGGPVVIGFGIAAKDRSDHCSLCNQTTALIDSVAVAVQQGNSTEAFSTQPHLHHVTAATSISLPLRKLHLTVSQILDLSILNEAK